MHSAIYAQLAIPNAYSPRSRPNSFYDYLPILFISIDYDKTFFLRVI
jgi:hypothetical protein